MLRGRVPILPRFSQMGPQACSILKCSKSEMGTIFVEPDYKTAFYKLGLISIDSVFSFNAGKILTKNNLAKYRSRLQFEVNLPTSQSPVIMFLKRYEHPPILLQLKNWLQARRKVSCGLFHLVQAKRLAKVGINTPKIISYGQQWGTFFEKRSFIITEKIPNAHSLEQKLPNYFYEVLTKENLKLRREFIAQLGSFIRKFHQTGYCHRDLYLSHIFYDNNSKFYLIDLARVFKPILLRRRFQVKDIAQIHYSAPAKYFSRTDRLRFYLSYTNNDRLSKKDKLFIRKVVNKAKQMARHNIKHGRIVPFLNYGY